jgi:hypothetical protein
LPPVVGKAARPIRVQGASRVPSLKRKKALPKSDADEALASLLEWSEPVVFDCLRECYGFRLEESRAKSLAHRHVRQWRALIAGDMARFEDLRRDLFAALAAFKLDVGCAIEADARALAEVYEIAMARFDRSPRSAQAYRNALTVLAAKLAPPKDKRAA